MAWLNHGEIFSAHKTSRSPGLKYPEGTRSPRTVWLASKCSVSPALISRASLGTCLPSANAADNKDTQLSAASANCPANSPLSCIANCARATLTTRVFGPGTPRKPKDASPSCEARGKMT